MFIKQISAKNYRSLKDVAVGDLSEVVVLYGENNSGKSNLLSFLEQIFKRKNVAETLSLANSENSVPQQSEDFWKGEMENFSDNFYQNTRNPIEFSVLIVMKFSEFSSLESLPPEFLEQLVSQPGNNHLNISGRIEKINESTAVMVLEKVDLNKKSFYEISKDKPVYLKGFPFKKGISLDSAMKLDIFQAVMSNFNDVFLRISPDRFVLREEELDRGTDIALTHSTFKNWLFQTSMNRETERTFRDILSVFQEAPFNHGRITLARVDPNLIDVFIEEENAPKLPIDRKGSGIQQILMILSFVAMAKAKIIGIEEPEINLSPRSQMAIFNNLFGLVHGDSRVLDQIIMTTHSPRIASRSEASRRGVWMTDGKTSIKKPTEAEVTDFFTKGY